MLGVAVLGTARDDVTAFVKSLPVVGDKLASALPTLEAYIRDEAEEGARAAVKPYVLGALALGGLGALLGGAALVKLKRRGA